MNKNQNMLILAAIGLAAGIFYLGYESPPTPARNTDQADFAAIGIVRVQNPGTREVAPFLTYGGTAGSTTTVELVFDALSMCSAEMEATPCVYLSANFDQVFQDRQVIAEGNRMEEGIVLVRKLRLIGAGEPFIPPKTGDVFVFWYEIGQLAETCAVRSITQTQALDVYVTLRRGGQTYRSVEPYADDIVRLTERAQAKCGSVAVE